MQTVSIHDKNFHIYIERETIRQRVDELGRQITASLENEKPLFVAVLNGSFMFAADLMKSLHFPCEIQFVKVSSYHGTQTTGKVRQVLGLAVPAAGRHLVVIEDIIDSGFTMDFLCKELLKLKPASLQLCSLLVKPNALKVPLEISFTGFEVENQFLVGYGLDYDGYGRNLPHIYQAMEE